MFRLPRKSREGVALGFRGPGSIRKILLNSERAGERNGERLPEYN